MISVFLIFICTIKSKTKFSEGRIRCVEHAWISFQSIYILEINLLGRDIHLKLIL